MEQTIYSILVSVKENWLIIILMSSNQSAIVNFLEKSFCYSIHCWIMVQKNDFYKILWILEWCSIYFKCGKSFLFSFSLKWSLLVFLFLNVLSEIVLDWMSSSSLIFLPKTKDKQRTRTQKNRLFGFQLLSLYRQTDLSKYL